MPALSRKLYSNGGSHSPSWSRRPRVYDCHVFRFPVPRLVALDSPHSPCVRGRQQSPRPSRSPQTAPRQARFRPAHLLHPRNGCEKPRSAKRQKQ
ncbi:unnamed protein product [Closterium sp. Yama58-4]|nr:unnamed protein product [Closterium sp. Yama58-4]